MNKCTPKINAALMQEIRKTSFELMFEIVDYFKREKKQINEIIFVPTTLFSRIVRTFDAIDLLLKNNHPSEAAVLTLTQFELRLDLAYVATDVEHATEWLDHEDTKLSLMRVTERINSLFTNQAQGEILFFIFRCLSGIKHGNPVYSELGFPVRTTGREILISTEDISDEFSEEFAKMLVAYSAFQLAFSSQVLNTCTAKYAAVDKSLRVKVRDLYVNIEPFEKEFCDFLKEAVSRHKSAFSMKALISRKNH